MQSLPTCIHIWCSACGGKQLRCSRRSVLLETLLSQSMMAWCVLEQSHLYIYTWGVCVCVFVCVCAQMSASLCNTIVRCHLQSAAVLAAPPPAHKSQQIKTLHSIKSSEKPVYWWSGVKTTGGWTGRWREREGERERWGVRVAEAARQPGSGRLQGLLLSAIVEGARWDNWSPKLNAQHAFLMSPHCCSFNI